MVQGTIARSCLDQVASCMHHALAYSRSSGNFQAEICPMAMHAESSAGFHSLTACD